LDLKPYDPDAPRPFVPHNLISTQESPVPLLKSQMAPKLKIFMSAGAIKRPQLFFSILSKILANEHSPGSPTGALWKEILLYRVFCISLENLIKIRLIRRP
jgi:hypothetical protein